MTPSARASVVTIVHGRHDHFSLQREGLRRSTLAPLEHIVVAMDDPDVPDGGPGPRTRVIDITRTSPHLPLAAARNAGARAAFDGGADVAVFLDVDCVPSPDLVAAYRDAASRSDTRDHLLCGPVTYLPPAPVTGYSLHALASLDAPHPARPAPEPGRYLVGGDHSLFWSLSFAVGTRTWERIGGFDERYEGYGGEDTDFGQRARHAGVELAWIGDARAYHQHHPVESPPVRHVRDIVRNGEIFAQTWGWWPMTGWLDALRDAGLVTGDAPAGYELALSSHEDGADSYRVADDVGSHSR